MTPSSPTTPMIAARSLTKVYGGDHRALTDVSLDVAPGEVVAIIGPSGCGKSTLLRCLNGLENIQGGSIEYRGASVPNKELPWHRLRQDIGMVFQNYELFGHLDVLENLILGPVRVQGRSRDEAAREAAILLTRVGLASKARSWPRELSGGQKQRVAIVRALMMRPTVLLLDEITASLDPEMVREVLDVVAGLARDGMTLVIVTHEMAFAEAVADRIVFMDAGSIVEEGPARDFFARPGSERARAFLNVLDYSASADHPAPVSP